MNLKAQTVLCASLMAFGCSATCNPSDFVFLSDVDNSIIQEIRYYSPHNFMGRRVEGYNSPDCVLTKAAAEGLAKVQKEAMSKGFSLKVYDCYRPQRAVDDFVAWSNNSMDELMKTEFYPTLDKPDLFPDYIATKSGHTRGSTMDLTIVPTPAAKQETYLPGQPLVSCFAPTDQRFGDNTLDMGTGFDCLSSWANTDTDLVR
jgi:zinc D-Ala-D-Ala dipeptidase